MNRTTTVSLRLVAVLLLAGAATALANLVANPSFETGEGIPTDWWTSAVWGGDHAGTGWTYINNGTPGVDTYEGSRSVTLSHPAMNDERWYLNTGGFAVTPGETLVYSAYIKTANFDADDSILISMDYYNSGHGYAGEGFYAQSFGNGDWRQLTVTGVVPDGVSYVAPLLRFFTGTNGTSPANSSVIFDAVSVVPEPASLLVLAAGAALLAARRRRS